MFEPMTMTIEIITPELAKEYLSKMPENQRRLRPNRVIPMCHDRMAGRWITTHQGVAFNVLGQFIDGQHRMEMVIKTGLPTEFAVFRNVPVAAFLHLDEQMPRSTRDALLLSGRGNFDEAVISVARLITAYPVTKTKQTLSKEEILEQIEQHKDALHFIMETLPKRTKGITRSLRTLVCRAWYGGNHDRLREWCNVCLNGIPVSQDASKDTSAIIFRNFVSKTTRLGAGEAIERERYQKGQSALDHFLRGQPMTKLYGTEEDLFPLPDPAVPVPMRMVS